MNGPVCAGHLLTEGTARLRESQFISVTILFNYTCGAVLRSPRSFTLNGSIVGAVVNIFMLCCFSGQSSLNLTLEEESDLYETRARLHIKSTNF